MIKKYAALKKSSSFLDIDQEVSWIEKALEPTVEPIVSMPVHSPVYQRAHELRTYFIPILEQLRADLMRMDKVRRRNKPSNNNKQQ